MRRSNKAEARRGEVFQLRDVERRLRQLSLLQETVKKVNSILDLEQLLDELVGSVAETFGCTRTAVLLRDEQTEELEMTALRGFSDVHLKGYRFKIGVEGMVGHVGATRKMRYSRDVRKDPYYVPSEPSTLSEVDIPLIIHGKLIGIFDAQSSTLDAFSPEQIEILCALADNIAIAVENARLFKRERLEKEKALREQLEAHHIQRALLPEGNPDVPGYTIDGVCLQLSAVGGDWYDYIPLSDGKLGLALGDVCGKGMAAALLMAATRSLLRRAAAGDSSPSEVLSKLNHALLKDLPEERFVTMAYLVLDSATPGRVDFAIAGHPPPILITTGSTPRPLESTKGYPLGLLQSEYSAHCVTLEPGDRILVYSDGVLEARGGDDEEYGVSRLLKAAKSPTLSANELLVDVQKFAHAGSLSDDATAIVIRRNQ